MAVTLYLDVGNSACKWRLTGNAAVQQGSFYHQGDWSPLLAALSDVRPERIVVASVAGQESNARLTDVLQASWRVTPVFYTSAAQVLGVTNAYTEPQRLGVDRWLGVVEAHASYGASIIIDSGSALTIDAVTATGQHLGGYIVPGLNLMRQSLRGGTAGVRPDERAWSDMSLGVHTDGAVTHGILRMTVAFVTEVVVALERQLADTCTTVITGGDAPVLKPLLSATVRHRPDLVLDGLVRIADNID